MNALLHRSIAVAVIGAFVATPEVALIVAIIGLVLGVMAVGAIVGLTLVLTLVLAAVSGCRSIRWVEALTYYGER